MLRYRPPACLSGVDVALPASGLLERVLMLRYRPPAYLSAGVRHDAALQHGAAWLICG
jgi:hypothetical protein